MLFTKRLFDAVAAALMLIMLAPVLGIVALLIWREFGRPILFSQRRIGKGERSFMLYKFRTMRNANGPDGLPLSDKERLTRFGAVLRATSLDELPELWNILRGDMSFIGPRPLLPEYVPYYTDQQRARHRMRPGLSGLAQVNGRNLLNWDERLAMDVTYVTNWSWLLDVKILLSTVRIVLSRRGVNHAPNVTMHRFDDYMRERGIIPRQ